MRIVEHKYVWSSRFPFPRYLISSLSFFPAVHYRALSKKPLILTGQCPEAIHSFRNIMDASYLSSTEQALEHFAVDENQGLSEQQIQRALGKYGRNGTVHHHISV